MPRQPTTPTRPPTRQPPRSKARPVILTLSVAAITVTGAYYGASLKTSSPSPSRTPTTDPHRGSLEPAGRLSVLETQRSGLEAKRSGLERKIAEIETRIRGREERKEEGGGRS